MINLELTSYDISGHDATYSKPSEESEDDSQKFPKISIQLERDEESDRKSSRLKSESSIDATAEEPFSTKEIKFHQSLSSPRPMLIKSLRNANEESGSRIIEDLRKSLPLRSPTQPTSRISEKAEPEVILDTSIKGTGLILSDFTSESSSQSEFEPQSRHAPQEHRLKVIFDF